MKRHKLYLSILLAILCSSIISKAQTNNYDWIDPSKTYYQFKVSPVNLIVSDNPAGTHISPGLYQRLHRIPYSTLLAAGLQNTPVENFQLWRNGQQVALYTQPASGVMDANGFLEFWGLYNDGSSDSALYRNHADQLNKQWSLFTDTSLYSLTVNASTANARILQQPNTAASSQRSPITHLPYSLLIAPKSHVSLGYSNLISGFEVRSSAFELGEGMCRIKSSGVINSISITTGELYAENMGSNSLSVKLVLMGSNLGTDIYNLKANGTTLQSKSLDRQQVDTLVGTVPVNTLLTGANTFSITANSTSTRGTFALYSGEIAFERSLKFDKQTNSFLFTLEGNTSPALLKFVDFNNSVHEKVLIDFTNNKRYTAHRVADSLYFELPAMPAKRQLVLTEVNTTGTNASLFQVSTLTAKTFTNFTQVQNQPNYIIISNKKLMDDRSTGADEVDAYRAYRSSAAGGANRVGVFDVNAVYDHFGFGIPNNPLAFRNFITYAATKFAEKPKAVLLIGRGAMYHFNQSQALTASLSFVPTWGEPASDNLLASPNNVDVAPQIPIGRIAAIDGIEIKNYLNKVKDFEAIQQDPAQSKIFQKEALHLIGGFDAPTTLQMRTYMKYYEDLLHGPSSGADVLTFERTVNPNAALDNAQIQSSVSDGIGLITYFGHSSPVSIDFNLNFPEELNIPKGKYPVFIANGCKAAEIFDLNPYRISKEKLTIGERFIFAPDAGSIAFFSSTHFGILQNLDEYTRGWYRAAAQSHYGKSIGAIHAQAIREMQTLYGYENVRNRLTAEELHLHGDPVLVMNTLSTPDYTATQLTVSPSDLSIALDSVTVRFTIRNLGMANTDSLMIRVNRQSPDGEWSLVKTLIEPGISSAKTYEFAIPVRGIGDVGTHLLQVQADVLNQVTETIESNNNASTSFTLKQYNTQLTYPQNYSIINTWPVSFNATSNNLTSSAPLNFTFELDTTRLFNSPIKYVLQKQSPAGNIQFLPAFTPVNGTTYYWRVAEIINGQPGTWGYSSFTYMVGSTPGYRMGHYYQHTEHTMNGILLNPNNRSFEFAPRLNNLYINHGIYPTSGTENSHFAVVPNNQSNITSLCIGQSVVFNVFDSLSFEPWKNLNQAYGSAAYCAPGREYNFEFKYYPASNRKKIMDFIDAIPKGSYVVARLGVDPDPGQPALPTGKTDSTYVSYWKNDTLQFGSGNSLYHKLVAQGFSNLDELASRRTFAFVFKKDDPTSFAPISRFSAGLWDRLTMNVNLPMTDTAGDVISPWLGPAAAWNEIHWRGKSGFQEPNGQVTDNSTLAVFGKTHSGDEVKLFELSKTQQDITLANEYYIDANQYPFVKMQLHTGDSSNVTPYPLDYWQINHVPVAEGALSAADYFETNVDASLQRDTILEANVDLLKFGIAFKNIGSIGFTDSLTLSIASESSEGFSTFSIQKKIKAPTPGDTVKIYLEQPVTVAMVGKQKLRISVNMDGAVPEQNLQNNQYYYNYEVRMGNLPAGKKYFVGTGRWNDGNKWSPLGVPVCGDQVVVLGAATLDASTLVSDSLLIDKFGSLTMANSTTLLKLGCTENGGKSLLTNRGRLTLQAGTLQINGTLQIVDGAYFSQTGGQILLDPSNMLSEASAQLAMGTATNATNPLATFAVGGRNTDSNSDYRPFHTGSLQLTGGTIHFVDPPANAALSVYLNTASNTQTLIDSAHTMVFGYSTLLPINSTNTNHFRIETPLNAQNQPITIGSILVRTGNVPNRELQFTSTTPYHLHIKGSMGVEQNSKVRVLNGNKITIGTTAF